MLLICTQLCAQNDSITKKPSGEKRFVMRAGIDAASLLRTALDKEYTGFQVLGDLQINKDLFIAVELGNEQIDRQLDRIDFKTNGSFIKLGLDRNFYDNWLGANDMLYAGGRIGIARFSQQLDRYTYNTDYTDAIIEPQFPAQEFDGLSAVWIELQAGIKVEVLPHFYLNAAVHLRRMITQQQPDNFANLYVPGFGRTYDTSSFGVGYHYGVLYQVPLF